MPVPNIDNPKETAPSNDASGSQGMNSQKAINISSDVSINLSAPVITLNADSINITGNVAINGTLTVNGVPVP